MNRNLQFALYSLSLFIGSFSCTDTKSSDIPEVETIEVTGIRQTTAISGGIIISAGGSDIVAKGICWSTEAEPDINDRHSNEGSGPDDFSSNIDSLFPDTEYHIRSYATNHSGTGYGKDKLIMTQPLSGGSQIIADHTVVEQFANIPPYYIEKVKKMWFVCAGESHSMAYMSGLTSLEQAYPVYDVNYTSTPEASTSEHLRISRTTWGDIDNAGGWINSYGDEDWFMSELAISRTKAGITYCRDHHLELTAICFGWCYDSHEPAFISKYLSATSDYEEYCKTNDYLTRIIYSTGPVDFYTGENAYTNHLRWEQIRNYVKEDPTRILFDYADILCYDDGSIVLNTLSWNGNIVPTITSNNSTPDQTGHISNKGSIRLAKAVWWMLARIAGWDGN